MSIKVQEISDGRSRHIELFPYFPAADCMMPLCVSLLFRHGSYADDINNAFLLGI